MVVPKVAPAPIQPTKMAPPGPPRERRRKTHGLYFHSSPPKVLQMNNQNVQRDNDSRIKDGLIIKPSNIRIWLHQKHLAKLAKVIWAGQGMRLRTETSHHPKMKRFLECVPHVMGVIKDVHQAVVDNDLDTLKEKTASPTPRIVLTSKDANGLTPLHKAAGLAHTQIVEYILSIWPSLSSDVDHTGKTPLHWAASAKNNARSFNLLVQAGADETALDHRDKAAEYYKNRPNEIDRSLLTVIPEAPRISQQGFPAFFDWTMFTLDVDTDDSNGSQTRMKPFLSQNNLLDNDVNNYNSVSKSKSVHNLTNGTLTDLPNDESESETKNKEESTVEELDEEPPETNEQESTDGDDAVGESEEVVGDVNGDGSGPDPEDNNEPENTTGEVFDVEEESKIPEDTNQAGPDENGQFNEVNDNGGGNGTQNDTHDGVAIDKAPIDTDSTARQKETTPVLIKIDQSANTTEETSTDSTNNDEQQENVDSPSPALEINGTVEGEPDGGQLHSGRPSGDLDSFNGQSIQETIESGDMEQLAVIVLNGDGGKLLGRRSEQPEIQAFLDNVPSYMNKIRRVHVAAREGSLRDLQSALDRRKFATAKDSISPHGATPLHVATIFGHSGIVRYLAGRFPETTSATDNNGRTPLHYAATLKDNGHFYNLLAHLGANPKVEDNSNHSAEFYLDQEKTKDLLSHRQLLQDYGAEEDLAESMLNDQVPDDQHSARRELDDVDTLTTLERCFKIIHEPIEDRMKTLPLPTNSVPGSASSLRILITSYLAKFMKRNVFDKIKKRQTKLDHNLFDVIWPAMKKATKEKNIDEDFNVGIVIPDYDVFVVFQEFLVPLIKDMHCMELQQEFFPHPSSQFFPRYVIEGSPNQNGESNGNVLRENPCDVDLNLDTSGKFITGVVIECTRNLDEFDFPLNLSIAQLEKAERILTAKILSMAFANAIGEDELGTYYTMNEILESPSEIRTILATAGLLIPMLDHSDPYQIAESIALNGKYWPYGRGVYVSHKQDLVAWINAQEHLRVLCCTSSKNPANIGSAYSKIGRAMTYLEDKIHFKHSYFLGYLVSRPSFLGTGLKITLFLELTQLQKEMENLRHLCLVRGLHLLTSEDQSTIRMSNMRSLSQTEWQIFQDYTGAITNIVALEKELSLSNSLHIAATLLKIFRKKKNSLVEAAPTH
ncbi:uncharacterized protein LOC134212475 isoform X4 [Armigeres subalbatus]|uniref:uncharacterized protein LOC134212475 isoform X4 n=1 Tax=Armigeres subalbatus TaxID=124917 RepID=UPI002ED3639E